MDHSIFIHSSAIGYLDCHQIFANLNIGLNILTHTPVAHLQECLLGIYLGEELLGDTACKCSIL